MEKKLRGGRRPNAGRKPEGDEVLTATIIARVTPDQKSHFLKKGGGKWLRSALTSDDTDVHKGSSAVLVGQVLPRTRMSIPVFQYSVQAGFPSPAESYKENLDFNELLVDNLPSTFVLRVSGQSMVDAGLSEDDLIIVDRARSPRNGDIVVMEIDHEYTVKRFILDGEGFYLKAENSSGQYPDIYPQEGQEWRLFGVVNYVIKAVSGKATAGFHCVRSH